jgi:signal transduction histidine kinase
MDLDGAGGRRGFLPLGPATDRAPGDPSLAGSGGPARHISSSTLNERIRPAGKQAEIVALAETFNAMLERLEESFTRLTRFSADIAHELRTPVE